MNTLMFALATITADLVIRILLVLLIGGAIIGAVEWWELSTPKWRRVIEGVAAILFLLWFLQQLAVI